MNRILVSEKELIEILNKELHKTEDLEDYRFDDGVIRLRNVDENGCNWSEVYVRASGVSIEPVLPLADKIINEAKKQYNLK